MTQLNYFLALLNADNLIFKFGHKLYKAFPHLEELFAAKTENLTKLGLPLNEIAKLKKPNWQLVEQDLQWAKKPNNYIITIEDPNYPQILKEISNPPLILFVSGNLSLLKQPQLAIVGSRNPTPTGLETAAVFAKELAQAGLVITSGFAKGIDATSHKGAIDAAEKTIAVMGTGLNQIYPSSNLSLAQKILENDSTLVSEFPLNTKAQIWHFPLRNRIISGLSIGTLVVEATIRSGSLITARLANEQGREVFAIPGSIYSSLSCGCHYLISQGAKLVETTSDILEEFAGLIKCKKLQISSTKKLSQKNKLDPQQKKLLNCVGFEITTMDLLVMRTGWTVQKISTILLELELNGLIKTVVNGYIK